MVDTPTGRRPRVVESQRYQIRVRGHLADRWAASFAGMTLARHDDGTTVIDGSVADQSALHGLLRKVNDLGLPLVSVSASAADARPTRSPDRRSTT